MLTQEYLKSILDYNKDTGIFTWVKNISKKVKIGNVAGTNHICGYKAITINKKKYLLHRLAWIYVYGKLPKYIDHINGIRYDNRIENLRDVTFRENCQNTIFHRLNKNRLVGTTFSKDMNKWISHITLNSKNKHLGYFNTEKEAHTAYINKIKELGL